MVPGISLDDRGAWDDAALINSWDEAVNEYEKYHSISRSGKRLEDVLSEAELKKLREEHGDLIADVETKSRIADPNAHAGHKDAVTPQTEANGIERGRPKESYAEEQAASGHQERTTAAETSKPHGEPLEAAMPQALLGTVQDENLKNLMMSWYYAGYYTGLHTGQRQAVSSNNATKMDVKSDTVKIAKGE